MAKGLLLPQERSIASYVCTSVTQRKVRTIVINVTLSWGHHKDKDHHINTNQPPTMVGAVAGMTAAAALPSIPARRSM